MVKVGNDIPISKSMPLSAWHHQIYRTNLGLVFFKIEGENKNGPFRIQVQILRFLTEEIATILEFKCAADADMLYHVYIFE
jgi:hypothetical protein